MKKDEIEKYGCSVHGGDGDPDCGECWARLGDFLGLVAPDAEIVADPEIKRRLRT